MNHDIEGLSDSLDKLQDVASSESSPNSIDLPVVVAGQEDELDIGLAILKSGPPPQQNEEDALDLVLANLQTAVKDDLLNAQQTSMRNSSRQNSSVRPSPPQPCSIQIPPIQPSLCTPEPFQTQHAALEPVNSFNSEMGGLPIRPSQGALNDASVSLLKHSLSNTSSNPGISLPSSLGKMPDLVLSYGGVKLGKWEEGIPQSALGSSPKHSPREKKPDLALTFGGVPQSALGSSPKTFPREKQPDLVLTFGGVKLGTWEQGIAKSKAVHE